MNTTTTTRTTRGRPRGSSHSAETAALGSPHLSKEEIEEREGPILKAIDEFVRQADFEFKTKKQTVLLFASEFEKAGTVRTDRICLRLMRALKPLIDKGIISTTTIRQVLPDKYKLKSFSHYRGKNKAKDESVPPTISETRSSDANILNEEIQLLSHLAGLPIEKIQKMSVGELMQSVDGYMKLIFKSWIEHDLHVHNQVLNYLMPIIRKAVELNEDERNTRRNQSKMLTT
jgi:hypothetical protein